jgi:hypothetical protein
MAGKVLFFIPRQDSFPLCCNQFGLSILLAVSFPNLATTSDEKSGGQIKASRSTSC